MDGRISMAGEREEGGRRWVVAAEGQGAHKRGLPSVSQQRAPAIYTFVIFQFAGLHMGALETQYA